MYILRSNSKSKWRKIRCNWWNWKRENCTKFLLYRKTYTARRYRHPYCCSTLPKQVNIILILKTIQYPRDADLCLLNVPNSAIDLGSKGAVGVTSPPHSLSVSAHSANYVTITWQPPEFSHVSEEITYK